MSNPNGLLSRKLCHYLNQGRISLSTDDNTLYYSAKCPIHLHRVLSQDLSTLYNWSKVWNINFNPSKTAVMTISNQRNIHPPLFFNNIHLSETDTHKHLGLIFHHRSLLTYSYSPPWSESDDQNKSSSLIFKFITSPLSPYYLQNKYITDFWLWKHYLWQLLR